MNCRPNCLLSEFHGTPLEKFFTSKRWGINLALMFLVGAIVVVILGHLAKANALNRQILLTLQLASGPQPLDPINLIGGYLAQANHGFLYLIVAPFTVIAASKFIESASGAFETLCSEGRLRRRTYGAISYINRRRFRFLWWFLPLLFVLGESVIEFYGYHNVEETGYVQAPWLAEWQTNFYRRNGWQLLLARHETGDAEREIMHAMESASVNTIGMWHSNQSLSFIDPADAIPELWPELARRGNITLNLTNAYSRHLFDMRVKISAYPATRLERAVHILFVISLLSVEGTFQGFAAWVFLKAIFWILVTGRLLPSAKCRGRQKIMPKGKLSILLKDPRKHFGLSDLNEPYNWLVMLIAISAFVFPLVIISGLPRIAPGDFTAAVQAYTSSALVALLAAAPAVVLGLGPVFLFNRRLNHLRQQELAALNAQLEKSRKDPDRESLEAQRELIGEQTCWPKEDATFKFLFAATLFFAVIPIFLHFKYIPPKLED